MFKRGFGDGDRTRHDPVTRSSTRRLPVTSYPGTPLPTTCPTASVRASRQWKMLMPHPVAPAAIEDLMALWLFRLGFMRLRAQRIDAACRCLTTFEFRDHCCSAASGDVTTGLIPLASNSRVRRVPVSETRNDTTPPFPRQRQASSFPPWISLLVCRGESLYLYKHKLTRIGMIVTKRTTSWTHPVIWGPLKRAS